MPERITRAEIEEEFSDDQVDRWRRCRSNGSWKGLDGAALLDALTAGQRAVYLVVTAQGAIHNGGVSHLYERDDIATPELVAAAERIGAGAYAGFFDEVIRRREAIGASRASRRSSRIASTTSQAMRGTSTSTRLRLLVLTYADQHPDEFFEP